ncbi:MAG: hypothetical protein ACOYM3_04695 [Terrimicrobiaceae bacterium]
MPIGSKMVVCPKEYQTAEWGSQVGFSDVWEGPMSELIAYRDTIKSAYTTTQIAPTKGGHGRLVATISTVPGTGAVSAPTGDIMIEVEWVELRLPVQSNPAFDELTELGKRNILNAATASPPVEFSALGLSGFESAEPLYKLILKGTTEWSTGVPVIRRTTKNASGISRGSAWYRDTPPVSVPRGGSGGTWEWMKTVDRRTKIGADIVQIEEWTGSETWDAILYP